VILITFQLSFSFLFGYLSSFVAKKAWLSITESLLSWSDFPSLFAFLLNSLSGTGIDFHFALESGNQWSHQLADKGGIQKNIIVISTNQLPLIVECWMYDSIWKYLHFQYTWSYRFCWHWWQISWYICNIYIRMLYINKITLFLDLGFFDPI
jgi:hypothetical protein